MRSGDWEEGRPKCRAAWLWGTDHWKPTDPQDPSRHPLNLVTQAPPSHFLNLFQGVTPALPHPGLGPPGCRDSHNRAQHWTVQLTIFLADSWQKLAFKLNEWHTIVQLLHIISFPPGVVTWDSEGLTRSAPHSSLMFRESEVSEQPSAKWLMAFPIFQALGEKTKMKMKPDFSLRQICNQGTYGPRS